jgi:hypothetical protein
MGKPPRSRQRVNKACSRNCNEGNSSGLKPLKPAAAGPATANAAAIPSPMIGDQLPSRSNGGLGTVAPSWPHQFDYESILEDGNPSLRPVSPDFSKLLGDSTGMAPGPSYLPLSECPDILCELSKEAESMSKMLESTLHNAMYERLTPISVTALACPAIGRHSDNQRVIETTGPTVPSVTSPSNYQCVRLAMETLDCLYRLSSSANSFDAGLSKPTVDHILQVNGDAMEAAATVLACPCTKDFCLLIILAMIPCKVLAGYQAVVNMRDPHIQAAASEATTCHEIAVGPYTLDEEASRMVIIQAVLVKLGELSTFVQTYIDTFCFDANKNRQGHCGLVYRTLGLFIQNRLGTTTDVLQEKLSFLVEDGKLEFK